jgi:preprotein translocase subunit SecE
MATVAQEKKAPTPSPASPDGTARRSLLRVYKPGEGTVTRLGLFVTLAAFLLYACQRWFYHWTFFRDLLGRWLEALQWRGLVDWAYLPTVQRSISWGGVAVLGFGGGLILYYYLYVKPKSAEFLVQTDLELKKVTWPRITPWFKIETPVWGATYVVLIVVVLLALYVFGVDWVFTLLAERAFYRG